MIIQCFKKGTNVDDEIKREIWILQIRHLRSALYCLVLLR